MNPYIKQFPDLMAGKKIMYRELPDNLILYYYEQNENV